MARAARQPSTAGSVRAGSGTRLGTALPGAACLLFQLWLPAQNVGAGCQGSAQEPAVAAGCGARRSDLGGQRERG